MYSVSGWTNLEPNKPSLWKRLTTNRYHPASRYISLGDVFRNTAETWYCFTRRVPPGSLLHHNNSGQITGHTTMRSW